MSKTSKNVLFISIVVIIAISIMIAIALGSALAIAKQNPDVYQEDTEENISRLKGIANQIIEARGASNIPIDDIEDDISVEVLNTKQTYLSKDGLQILEISEIIVKNNKSEIITTVDENWNVLEQEENNLQESYGSYVLNTFMLILIVECFIFLMFFLAICFSKEKKKENNSPKD